MHGPPRPIRLDGVGRFVRLGRMRLLASLCVAASVIALVSCEDEKLYAELGRQEEMVRAKRDVLERLNEQLPEDGEERTKKLDEVSARLEALKQQKVELERDLGQANEDLTKARAELSAARAELAAFRNEFEIQQGE